MHPCVLVADRAEQAAAYEDAAAALRMALDLAPPTDTRRGRLLARRGLALAWSFRDRSDRPAGMAAVAA